MRNATNVILKTLTEGEKRFPDLTRAFREIIPKGQLLQDDAIVYIALYNLLKEGKIERIDTTREVRGQIAPNALFKLV